MCPTQLPVATQLSDAPFVSLARLIPKRSRGAGGLRFGVELLRYQGREGGPSSDGHF